MSSDLPHLPEFPNPPAFPAARRPAEVLADFLHDLFDAGVASVIDPLALEPGQHWRSWAEAVLQPPEAAVGAAAGGRKSGAESEVRPLPRGSQRPTLQAALEAAYGRLLLELPRVPAVGRTQSTKKKSTGGSKSERAAAGDLPPLHLPVAVEAARRLYQVCQVLAAPQQDKDELRKSFTADFRPTDTATFLSTFATWRYLPMVWDHVRQRLTIATGATLAMQELERLIREQLAIWPWPLRSVLALDITPEAASLALLDRDPLARRYLAEQLLTQAALAPSPRLAAWVTEHTPAALMELLGGFEPERLREPLVRSFGATGETLVKEWTHWMTKAEGRGEKG